MKNISPCVFLSAPGLSNDGVVGVAKGAILQEILPGAGFKTDAFIKETMGGLP